MTPQLGGSQGTPGEKMRATAGSGAAGDACLPGSAIGQVCNMRGMRAPPWKAREAAERPRYADTEGKAGPCPCSEQLSVMKHLSGRWRVGALVLGVLYLPQYYFNFIYLHITFMIFASRAHLQYNFFFYWGESESRSVVSDSL